MTLILAHRALEFGHSFAHNLSVYEVNCSDGGSTPPRSTNNKIMKGYIVLFKVKDENAEAFDKLLTEDYVNKSHNISELANVEGICGGDDYERNADAFYHEL